jgi:hypothetical protein
MQLLQFALIDPINASQLVWDFALPSKWEPSELFGKWERCYKDCREMIVRPELHCSAILEAPFCYTIGKYESVYHLASLRKLRFVDMKGKSSIKLFVGYILVTIESKLHTV